MSQATTDAVGIDRRADIEAALAQYPHISEDRLDQLIAWFRKEASAHDVALVASNAAIAEPYRRFRADHIDPLTSMDIVRAVLFATAVGLLIVLILWRAL